MKCLRLLDRQLPPAGCLPFTRRTLQASRQGARPDSKGGKCAGQSTATGGTISSAPSRDFSAAAGPLECRRHSCRWKPRTTQPALPHHLPRLTAAHPRRAAEPPGSRRRLMTGASGRLGGAGQCVAPCGAPPRPARCRAGATMDDSRQADLMAGTADRRQVLTGAVAALGTLLAGCAASPQPAVRPAAGGAPPASPPPTIHRRPHLHSATRDPAVIAARATVQVLCWHQLRDWQPSDASHLDLKKSLGAGGGVRRPRGPRPPGFDLRPRRF